jgi:hypothetical protein
VRTRVEVPITVFPGTGEKIQLNFPQRCVYCGGAAETQVEVRASWGKTSQHKQMTFVTHLLLPYCLDHAAVDRRYGRRIMLLWLAVFLIVFIGWFFVGTSFGPLAGTLPDLIIFLLLRAPCLSNFLLGFGAVYLVHGILRWVFPKLREFPFIGQDGGLGVTIKLHAARSLEFKFTNAEYAAEFARLNEAGPTSV